MARLLILGGTAEAAELSARLAGDDRLETVTSLAGLTRLPNVGAGRRAARRLWRPGRASHLPQGGSATTRSSTQPIPSPPRSPRMLRKRRRRPACRDVKLLRPPFERTPADRFIGVPDVEAAAAALPHGARVFLAAGRREIGTFRGAHGPLVPRQDDRGRRRPASPCRQASSSSADPPADPEAEIALLRKHDIGWIVSKDSGGQAGAKIVAARRLGIPVVLVDRPPAPAGPTVATVGEVMAWIEARLLSPRRSC